MRRLIPLLALALSGCATLDKNECLTADWRELGRQDGRAGYPQTRLGEHREACAEHGIRPDERRYNAGRNEGLQDYCMLDNALREGMAGRQYQGVCPSEVHRAFQDLNEAAYAVYDLRNDIANTDSNIDSLERELREDKVSDKRRNKIREELREQDRQRERQRDQLRQAERALDYLSEQLLR